MALQFPREWRFDDGLGHMPQGATADLIALVEKLAAQAPNAKAIYETFKGRFGSSGTSSSESWAQSDMVDSMSRSNMNTPEFIEAYWVAMTDVSDVVDIPLPENVNTILRKHSVGYAIRPPKLVQEVSTPISEGTPELRTSGLPGYEIGSRLGGGAFGEVFQASRSTLFCKFDFAIKFHNPSAFADQEQARERFKREAEALGKLRHRAIVSYSDAGIDHKGQLFLVMSLIEGTDLRNATEGMPASVAVAHMVEVLGAVSYAHDRGVLHRDLKPANILVRTADGQPIIVDFGQAYLIDDMTRASLTVSAVGTASYLPHEVLANPKTRSQGHDIYSCGVILYEILARRVPDPANYEALGQRDPHLAPLDEVIRKALARADLRFGSASEFRDALVAASKSLHEKL